MTLSVGLPRHLTHVVHGYTLADIYNIAVYAVRTDHWRPTLAWTERVEAAYSAVAVALYEAPEPPRRHELVMAAQAASAEVVASNMRHRGIDKRGATFGETRLSFARYWIALPGTPVEDRVVDAISLGQIWPRLTAVQQEALIALATCDDYAAAAQGLGLAYYTFCARVRHARLTFLRYWHEGEQSSTVWGRDKRKGRENTGRTAVRLLHRRERAA